MRLVVCYDASDNKRRRRLFMGLKGYLHPVQRSVFEGVLPLNRYQTLRRLIENTIDPHVDTVRIYHLTAASHALTELIGTSLHISAEPEDIII